MRAVNHALTGALIGLVVGEPVIAVPVALASHFVCDMIPHHRFAKQDSKTLRSKRFKLVLYADIALCVLLVLMLAIKQPANWQLAVVCAVVASSPDLLSVNRYISALRHKSWKPGKLIKFAGDIQWFERPIGAVIEVAWFVVMVMMISPFTH